MLTIPDELRGQCESIACAILRGDAIDWSPLDDERAEEAFVKFCGDHGVKALLDYVISTSGERARAPAGVRDGLRRARLIARGVDQYRYRELERVLQVCAERDIEPIVIKGAAVAHWLYPSPELRSRWDVDLFIGMADITPFLAVAESLGYVVTGPVFKSHQFTCQTGDRLGRLSSLDVHWRISNAPRFARMIGYPDALASSQPLPDLPGGRRLSVCNALMLACAHRVGSPLHDSGRLIWLYDIHLLISAMDDGQQIACARDAVARGVADVCLDGLSLARERFASVISAEAQQILAAAQDNGQGLGDARDSFFDLIMDDLARLPSLGTKARLVRELVFPSWNSLMSKYQKKNALWLPLLYLRYLTGGISDRLVRRN